MLTSRKYTVYHSFIVADWVNITRDIIIGFVIISQLDGRKRNIGRYRSTSGKGPIFPPIVSLFRLTLSSLFTLILYLPLLFLPHIFHPQPLNSHLLTFLIRNILSLFLPLLIVHFFVFISPQAAALISFIISTRISLHVSNCPSNEHS